MNPSLHRIATITGIPGAGKDFFINQLMHRGEIPAGLHVTSMGTELFGYLQNCYPDKIKTRDDLKYLSKEEHQIGYDAAIKNILSMQPLLLNSHIVTHRSGNILTSQEEIHRRILAERYIHICAEPELIIQHRAKDTSRFRIAETTAEINYHQQWALEVTRRLARDTNAEVVEIWNTHDPEILEQNIKKIGDQLQLLMKRSD